jgi:UDP-N-acetylglucosamine 2-epimerase (non-hydrolysing)
MKAQLVVGARPNYMKIAPFEAALEAAGDERVLVHTGDRFDVPMPAVCFVELDIARPDQRLNVGPRSHPRRSARATDTLREQAELPVTVTEWTNRVAPWPLSTDGVLTAVEHAVARGRTDSGALRPDGRDGHAAERVVAALGGGGDVR